MPYRTKSHIPVTLDEQRWASRKLRSTDRVVDETALFEAIARRREIVEEARKKTMRARRSAQKAAYALETRSSEPVPPLLRASPRIRMLFSRIQLRSGNNGRSRTPASRTSRGSQAQQRGTNSHHTRRPLDQLRQGRSRTGADARAGELSAHDRMPALLLYGATGMGKTKILRKFTRNHPSSFDHQAGITRMQIVSMQMPPEPDERSFWAELLDGLGSPINYGHTALMMRRTARELLRFVEAKVLIIDELHALLAGSHRQQQILLNTLRLLASDLKLPLILAGTADAKRALMSDRQLADRFEAVELPPWRNDEAYGRLLASYVAVLPLKRRSDLTSPAVRKALLDHTQGITVRLVRAIENLAIEAIRSGREYISQESLDALETFPPLLSIEERSCTLA